MGAGLTDVYVAGAVARWEATRHPGRRALDEPGLHGLPPCADDPSTRLLVTDDRAYDALAEQLGRAREGTISVFATAARCAELLDGHPAWSRSDTSTAMVCRELETLPAVPLPGELTVRPVRRLDEDAPDGVPLEDAVTAALRADPRIQAPAQSFAAFLRSLAPEIRLLAAVERSGAVRATAGSGTFGAEANVFFVNTDPGWRGRGIGRAMTTAALLAARDRGARRASLDATDVALGIYARLGFEAVSKTTRFTSSARAET